MSGEREAPTKGVEKRESYERGRITGIKEESRSRRRDATALDGDDATSQLELRWRQSKRPVLPRQTRVAVRRTFPPKFTRCRPFPTAQMQPHVPHASRMECATVSSGRTPLCDWPDDWRNLSAVNSQFYHTRRAVCGGSCFFLTSSCFCPHTITDSSREFPCF